MSEALDLLSGLVLDDGRRWGAVATTEQLADAAAILDPQSATPYHWLGRARGWSKTTDLAAVALVLLLRLAPASSRSYVFAADRDQAALLVDALAGLVRRSPELARLVDVNAWKVSARRSGASLEAMAADEASAWGLRPFFAACDELPMWPTTRGSRRLWEAVSSAVPKTPGGRLVVAGTAGDPSHWAARVREHGLGDPLWRVSEVLGPPPWMDPALVEEQRRRLPESSFRRLFENQWVSGEDRLVSEDDLRAAVTLDGPMEPRSGVRYRIGVDLGLKRDATVCCVAHLERRSVVLDRLAVWQGSRRQPVRLEDVEEWIEEAAARYHAAVTVDPWQAVAMVQRLRARGVHIDEFAFTAQSVGRLASTLFVLLREQALRLPDDEALLDELRNVRLRESSPGVLRIDHDSGRHDDRVIALALAAHRLVEKGEPRPSPRGLPELAVQELVDHSDFGFALAEMALPRSLFDGGW